MKIRLDETMYRKAQRIADSRMIPFARWASFEALSKYDSTDKPSTPIGKVTRANSVSVAIHLLNAGNYTINKHRVRECIAMAIEREEKTVWPYRYDRSSLEAVIQLETFLGRTCSYENAQAYIDKRIEERKEEIRVSEMKESKK